MQIDDTLKPAQVDLLYQAHHRWLRGWLGARVGCREHAADLAQDTFVRLLKARQVSPLKEPRAYLSSIARGLMIDQFRRRALENAYLESLASLPEQEAPSEEQRLVILDTLERLVAERLPEGEHFFPEDQITDRSSRFLAAELVREKIMRQLGAELPYQITVEIEEFKQQGHVLHIHALILVERDGQKKIIIGDKGERIKRIGSEARKDMEVLFDSKVMLNLWVKVKGGWSDDERALRSLGYGDL